MIRQLRDLGVFRVALTGGDPFARKDVWELIEYIRSLSMSFDILTNGIYLSDPKNADRLMELLPHSIQCSVYGSCPETHDAVTGVKGSFDKTIKTLRYFQNHNIPIALKSPMLTLNYEEYGKINQLANVLGATHQPDINITPKADGGTSSQNVRLNAEQMLELHLEKGLPFRRGIEKLVQGEYVPKKCDDPLCGGGRNSITIHHDGTVTPCLVVPYILGTIVETPIADILKGEQMKNWLGLQWSHRKGKCVDCSISDLCSFCPGDAYLEKGDYLMDNTSGCEIAGVRKKAFDIVAEEMGK